MPTPAAILRELHRLHQHTDDLRAEIDRGPRTLKAQEAKVAKQQEVYQQAQEAVKKLKVAIHEKEVSLKGKLQQITKHERQRNEATSKKEYDTLGVEIEHERKECRKLEDDILNDMEAAEAQAARLPEAEKEVQRVKQEVARALDDIQTRRVQLTDMLSAAHKQLQEVEATLPEDAKAQYGRLTAARGKDALSAVQGRTCTACYTEITTQNYLDLVRGQFVLCKSCGRMLYLAAQDEPQAAD
jgi:predicted  nucleic acid-binding Zn-ribbon protein